MDQNSIIKDLTQGFCEIISKKEHEIVMLKMSIKEKDEQITNLTFLKEHYENKCKLSKVEDTTDTTDEVIDLANPF